MIIKRKYATFWTLMKDKLTADVMVEAIKRADSNRSDQEIRDLLSMDAPIIFYQADLGSLIPGRAYEEMKLRLKRENKQSKLLIERKQEIAAKLEEYKKKKKEERKEKQKQLKKLLEEKLEEKHSIQEKFSKVQERQKKQYDEKLSKLKERQNKIKEKNDKN